MTTSGQLPAAHTGHGLCHCTSIQGLYNYHELRVQVVSYAAGVLPMPSAPG
jgi:hypothetical protein